MPIVLSVAVSSHNSFPRDRCTDCVMVSIKLCQDVENDEYIILCNFGGHITRNFGVIEVKPLVPFPPPPPPPPRSQEEKKKKKKRKINSPVWLYDNKVGRNSCLLFLSLLGTGKPLSSSGKKRMVL